MGAGRDRWSDRGAKLAHADDFIRTSEGMTPCSAGGQRAQPGQRQLIAIARAALMNPAC